MTPLPSVRLQSALTDLEELRLERPLTSHEDVRFQRIRDTLIYLLHAMTGKAHDDQAPDDGGH